MICFGIDFWGVKLRLPSQNKKYGSFLRLLAHFYKKNILLGNRKGRCGCCSIPQTFTDGPMEFVTEKPLPDLLKAVHRKDIRAVKKLLDTKGSDIEIRKPRWPHRVPMHIALELGDKEMIDTLLERGASVASVDHNGEPALHVAISYASSYKKVCENILEGLLIHGACVKFREPHQGRIALQTAVLCSSTKVVQPLLLWLRHICPAVPRIPLWAARRSRGSPASSWRTERRSGCCPRRRSRGRRPCVQRGVGAEWCCCGACFRALWGKKR